MQATTKLIIALGNPGKEYENTRHNVGFQILYSFAEKHQIKVKEDKNLLCKFGKGKLHDFDLLLAYPTTFMNKSGDALIKLLNWFKLNIKDLIVVHDEAALNLGKIRVSHDSGHAGHHGVESIIQVLGGNKEFTRLRIGIGPDPGGTERSNYVLAKFKEEEKIILKKIIDLSIGAIETIITKGYEETMNKYNGMEIV